MTWKLGEIASRLGAELEGDAELPIQGVAGLREARPGELSFLANPKYTEAVAETRASAVIVPRSFSGRAQGALLRVTEPYVGFLTVLRLFHPEERPRPRGIDARSAVHETADLGADLSIGPFAVIEAGARIDDGCWIGAGAYVGPGVRMGRSCTLHANVVLLHDVILGERVTVHAGAVLGSDGFGYVPGKDGHAKIPQVGTVVVEDDVEIGANVTIDRATLGETRIGRGVKIDNLVHIAHNVTVGERTLIVAQVGVSGSTQIGKQVIIGGQAGIAGHIQLGDGARVGAQAGVTKGVAPGVTVSGYPAQEHERAKKLNAHLRRLPALADEVHRLEARVRALEGKEGKKS